MNKNFKRYSMDNMLKNSRFDFCKNLKWFIIPPIVIIIVGIILMCTIGFNLGLDFTGGSVIKVYANAEEKIEDSEIYHIDSNNEDYNAMRVKIEEVLKENGLSIYNGH